MRAFRMRRLPEEESRVDRLVEAMNGFNLQPDYQRQSDLWSEEKRQLFIDSVINGFDVPKLYFHQVPNPSGSTARYAIVDGKQRLETLRSFFANKFSLSDDFWDAQADESAGEDPFAAAGKSYIEITRQHPELAGRLSRYPLDVVVIETADEEIIEELFSRLNEALPLNAPEKRNAFGGAMPPVIRDLVRSHTFFVDRLPIENKRYKQLDLATKFLFLVCRGDFVATKKRALDEFVKAYREPKGASVKAKAAKKLARKVREVLSRMADVFNSQDDLLSSVGLVTVYFMTFLKAEEDRALTGKLDRRGFEAFDQVRRQNRYVQRRQQAAIASGKKPPSTSSVRQDLAIFDRLMQSPNDGQALEYKYRILRAFLLDRPFRESLPKELRRRIGQE